jgi:glutamate synthase domain-containing protein 3
MLTIDSAGLHYRDLNARIREAASEGETDIELLNVNGQRYIGAGIEGSVGISIHGVPGNDLGAFMNGPGLMVHGNAQDAIGNTMNEGRIVVHGHAGDVLGYGMRGGKIFILGDVGYRVGIHMKAYRSQMPVLVVGGTAADFLGEYMAGGILIVLGLDDCAPRISGRPIVGDYCATGMHGGAIYLRSPFDSAQGKHFDESSLATDHAKVQNATAEDLQELRTHLDEFCQEFGLDLEEVISEQFIRLTPSSHRPYGSKYAA